MQSCVLLPYEITLFSNDEDVDENPDHVLLPYEITLFSNKQGLSDNDWRVLLPYEITLFSNTEPTITPLSQFYYLMKLHYSQTILHIHFQPY